MNLIGTSGNDVLTGGDEDDTLYGGKGSDTLDGGAHGLYGDTVDYASATFNVTVNLALGTATDDFGGTDTLLNIENINGGDFNDVLIGNAGNNRMTPAAGNDSLVGGDGFDTVMYQGSSGTVTVSLLTGLASGTAIGNDTLAAFEGVIGSDFNDTLSGSDAATLESLEGRGGNDSLNGRGGLDEASYESSPAAVLVNLGAGTAVDGWGGSDTLQNIENVRGSSFNDTLTGGSANNLLVGGAGNDSITGGDGDDTLDGGAGNDTLNGGAGNDTALFSSDFADYAVSANFLTGEAVVAGPDGTDFLVNVEVLQFADVDYHVVLGTAAAETISGTGDGDLIQGGGGNDSINAGAGDDYMDGGEGDDTMTGGNGDDTYVVDSAGDLVVEAGDPSAAASQEGELADNLGAGIDKVVASINYTLGNFVENLTLTGNASLTGSGNALSNALAGNAGNNVLTGAGGNDQINGGDGRDTATFAGQLSQYGVSGSPLGFTVNGNAANEGTDTLNNVERLNFADLNLALDLEAGAGMVAKILGAVFGSTFVSETVYVGVGLDFADGGLTYEALMQYALDYRLGADATNHSAVVQLLYLNVVGSAPDADTARYFTDLLDNGTYTVPALGVLAADTSFNTSNINLTGLMQTGLAYL